MAYFPFFIELSGQEGLVVGGGTVALRKIQKLLPYGARLTAAAPNFQAEILEIPELTRIHRGFCPEMVDGKLFVIAATDDAALNHEIFSLCRKRGILVNAVDDRDDCSFLFPALVRRGDLCVGISTGGASPAAAVYLKERIDALLPENFEEILAWLNALRGEIKARIPDERSRARCFFALFAAGMERGGRLDERELQSLLGGFPKEDA